MPEIGSKGDRAQDKDFRNFTFVLNVVGKGSRLFQAKPNFRIGGRRNHQSRIGMSFARAHEFTARSNRSR